MVSTHIWKMVRHNEKNVFAFAGSFSLESMMDDDLASKLSAATNDSLVFPTLAVSASKMLEQCCRISYLSFDIIGTLLFLH
jgi:hypothetical protein